MKLTELMQIIPQDRWGEDIMITIKTFIDGDEIEFGSVGQEVNLDKVGIVEIIAHSVEIEGDD